MEKVRAVYEYVSFPKTETKINKSSFVYTSNEGLEKVRAISYRLLKQILRALLVPGINWFHPIRSHIQFVV